MLYLFVHDFKGLHTVVEGFELNRSITRHKDIAEKLSVMVVDTRILVPTRCVCNANRSRMRQQSANMASSRATPVTEIDINECDACQWTHAQRYAS
jgi:hypothetical protein